ncbi:Eco57I restriction-modification methylase domain-containing protein [Acanthopleuribacter pedis]|uniref:site-specific DNA-methyltransferase (adenine-specific) n=1 Tax=Acanthopleuribacter pedis TaxID=442870 RepID=A0A8J7QAZ0_9BACT|nr:Eco57I restriction-modification methylase domain-containing protein [Acanthopleuribacter pedis]MBO1322156.1 Eco57I restriction-modification methylase domain-containing protein [Acanthopleuribacter pedis]
MDMMHAETLVQHLLINPFNRDRYQAFLARLFGEPAAPAVPPRASLDPPIVAYAPMGVYTDPHGTNIGLFWVEVETLAALSQSRAELRRSVALLLADDRAVRHALVAVSAREDGGAAWQLSWFAAITDSAVTDTTTAPLRRVSFPAGPAEVVRFGLNQLGGLCCGDVGKPSLLALDNAFRTRDLAEAFSGEYQRFYRVIKARMESPVSEPGFDESAAAKKCLARLVFRYFLQRTGRAAESLADEVPRLPESFFSNERITAEGERGSGFFDVLARFPFSPQEDRPFDETVAVNPEMLGNLFEQMLGSHERTSKGTFYTPRETVQFMCREALIHYLNQMLSKDPAHGVSEEMVRAFVYRDQESHPCLDEAALVSLAPFLDQQLADVRVCDPAVGSGAFLLGMLHELVQTRRLLRGYLPETQRRSVCRLKEHAIRCCLHGVDIDAGAIDIAALRLELALAVDADSAETATFPRANGLLKTGNALLDHDPEGAAFAWRRDFAEVFAAGGFDILIGNPPYLDSENMARMNMNAMRARIKKAMNFTRGNWDLYIAFFERGLSLIADHGVLCLITPDKWLSKPFGTALREHIHDKLVFLVEVGRDVFETAKVDAVITALQPKPRERFTLGRLHAGRHEPIRQYRGASLTAPYAFDFLFSPHLDALCRLEQLDGRLGDVATCENACATADAYQLKTILKDAGAKGALPDGALKVVNTGTAGKFANRWGKTPMTYLKDRYQRPYVTRATFCQTFSGAYQKRALTPKLIIKGLTLLDASIDETGGLVPGKSTLVIHAPYLHFLHLVVNAELTFFYIKEKYRGSSYNQGVNFTKHMLNNLPLPRESRLAASPYAKILSDYLVILHQETRLADAVRAFFVGLVNGLIYELYVPRACEAAGIKLYDHLGALPSFGPDTPRGERIAMLQQVYHRFQNPDHPLFNGLKRLNTIALVRVVRGALGRSFVAF